MDGKGTLSSVQYFNVMEMYNYWRFGLFFKKGKKKKKRFRTKNFKNIPKLSMWSKNIYLGNGYFFLFFFPFDFFILFWKFCQKAFQKMSFRRGLFSPIFPLLPDYFLISPFLSRFFPDFFKFVAVKGHSGPLPPTGYVTAQHTIHK